jgi:hypothetical protein
MKHSGRWEGTLLPFFATDPTGCHRNDQILRRFTPQDDGEEKEMESSWCVRNAPYYSLFNIYIWKYFCCIDKTNIH